MPFTPSHIFDLLAIDGFTAVAFASLVVAAAALLVRFVRGWPPRLVLVGAVAFFVVVSLRFAFLLSFTHGWLQDTLLLQGHVVAPVLSVSLQFMEALSYLLWVGLVCLCLPRLRKRPNQAMQRTAGRSTF